MTKPRTPEEIAYDVWVAVHTPGNLSREVIFAALREAADAARCEEREALRKRHIFGDEESGQAVYVEWRGRRYGKGPVLWAVTRLNSCLNKSGEWEYEPQPSSRDDAFIARCRWTSLDEALAAARSRAEEPR